MSASHFTRTNRPFALAAVLSASTLLVHVGVGNGRIMAPVMDADLPAFVRYTSLVCWHMVTLVLLGFALTYAYAARLAAHSLTLGVTALSVAFAVLFAAVAALSGVGFGEMPQAVAFVAIAAAGGSGLLHPPSRPAPASPRPLAAAHHPTH